LKLLFNGIKEFSKNEFEKDEIHIYGWCYHIGSGRVFNYNKKSKIFELIE